MQLLHIVMEAMDPNDANVPPMAWEEVMLLASNVVGIKIE
jgi:hypothetical protein